MSTLPCPPLEALEALEDEHIYLDVIHVDYTPTFPPAKCSLARSTTAFAMEPEVRKRKWSSLNIALVTLVVVLSALCCVFIVLYVTEKNQNEARSFHTTVAGSSRCNNTSSVSGSNSAEQNEGNCKAIKSELKEKRLAYETMCSNECTEKSILFYRRNTSDYVTSKGAPKMNEITVCFWIKTTQTTRQAHYVAYVEPNDEDGFQIAEPKSGSRAKIQDGKWHSFCWTWSSRNGKYKTYEDGKVVEEGVFSRGESMAGGGTWVLGQNTDTSEGAFHVNQMMQGEMTAVNVWDRVLSQKELLEILTRCLSKYKGNVKSWNDFKCGLRGKVKIVEKSTCCNKA